MTKKQRIEAFVLLGEYLLSDDPSLQQTIESAQNRNAWFTPSHTRKAVRAIGKNLTADGLGRWLAPYPFDGETEKTVGTILAGNIPLVGFHDILCALCAGFHVNVKPAADDSGLTAHVLERLCALAPHFSHKLAIVDKLSDFDLVIATGSDNSARYFNYYFGSKPHIIRKNRNSVAVIDGRESAEELRLLGHDIFDYFGLGCRSVSKLFVPEGYDMPTFFAGIEAFHPVSHHYKYSNNYDYNKSIYLINGDLHHDNGFLLVKPDQRTASPLAVLHAETYDDPDSLATRLEALAPQLQCVVSTLPLAIRTPIVGFGQSQEPALDDYADGVNTLDFLAEHR